MKEFKEEIVAKMREKATGERFVSLKETAAEMGIKHIKRHDVGDIVCRFRKEPVPGYSLVRLDEGSLFETLHLISDDTEFESEEDFLKEVEHD